MRFLGDENFPLPGVRRLRAAGIDIASVSEDSPGVGDSDVRLRAVREGRVLLTFDRDCGELIYRLGRRSPVGVVYFPYQPLTPEEQAGYDQKPGFLKKPGFLMLR